MDPETYSKKRQIETMEGTNSPNPKRAKTSPSPPKLWLNCELVPPHSSRLQSCPPNSLPLQSSTPFSIHSSTTFTSCSQSEYSSASIQVFEYPQTYDLPSQSYAPQNPPPRNPPPQSYPSQSYPQPPCRSPVASYWNMFPGFHPAGQPGVPYGPSNNFAYNCQTSSIYSAFSAGSGHPGSFPSATLTERPKQSGDARNTLINAIVSQLREIESTLATQQGFVKEMDSKLAAQRGCVEELLKMAALLGIY